MDQYLQTGDLDKIAIPLDFLGINYYMRGIARSELIDESQNAPRTAFLNGEFTDMGWEVYPPGIYQMLGRLHFDYGFPAYYITENGAAYYDQVTPDGEVEDPARISYIKRHLQMVSRAIDVGVPVRGYFAWYLLDNFEWAYGYSKRFGLVYVDYQTQRRIPKASARWYQQAIHANAVV